MDVMAQEAAIRAAHRGTPLNLRLAKLLRRVSVRLRVGTVITAGLVGTALASHNLTMNGGLDLLIEFASDKPVNARHHLTDSLTYGARFEVETETEVNFNLDKKDNEDTLKSHPKFELALAYEPNTQFRAFTELELSRPLALMDPDSRKREVKLELNEAYVTLRDPADRIALTIGRQYIGDEREWLLDEEVDGVELVLRKDNFALELAYGREGIVRRDLLQKEKTKRPDYFMARAFNAISPDSQVSAFALYQDGHEGKSNEDLLFLGIQSFGDLGNNVDFWADGAVVLGKADGRDVRGFGFDVGVTKTFKDIPMRPYVSAGLAFGSGDDGSGTDTAFRQSGLHGNSARTGGVTGFHYYGEVLDPELSNLAILTFDTGFRPTQRSSIDLVYHRYIQDRLEDDFRDVGIDRDPEGNHSHIGDEIDLVLGIKDLGNVDVELVGGVFLPGRAFEKRDPAFFGGLTLQIEF